MKPDFNYSSSPLHFVHCLNSHCLQADKCLRYQIALRMPPERSTVTIVNPAHTSATGENCLYFKADQLLLFARGMTHLLEHITYKDAIDIKQQMLNHFGRTLFYRFWRKERLINPSQQEYIQQLFYQKNISESPVFDEYIEQYEW